MSENDPKIISAQKIGIFISVAPSKKKRHDVDKFGFASEKEVVDFVLKNAKADDTFLVYTYESDVLRPLKAGIGSELI